MIELVTAGVILHNATQVLLQQRTADDPHWPLAWMIWGGHQEPEDGGDPVKTALRELREELDLELRRLDLEYLGDIGFTARGGDNVRQYSYHAMLPVPPPALQQHEGRGMGLFYYSQIGELEIPPEHKWALARWFDLLKQRGGAWNLTTRGRQRS